MMRPPTQVCLFGSLRKRLGDRKDLPIQLDLKTPTPLTEVLETLEILTEVLETLEIPSDAVQLSMVNYRAVPRDTTIYPGDRLSLFPKEYPVFVDWNDLRF
jgi:molybdopterin converting factor small subunit